MKLADMKDNSDS